MSQEKGAKSSKFDLDDEQGSENDVEGSKPIFVGSSTMRVNLKWLKDNMKNEAMLGEENLGVVEDEDESKQYKITTLNPRLLPNKISKQYMGYHVSSNVYLFYQKMIELMSFQKAVQL